MKNNYQKYLDIYAEPQARTLCKLQELNQSWSSALVLPCYAEAKLLESCLSSVESAASYQNQRPLIIIVINCKSSDTQEVIQQTLDCLQYLNKFTATVISDQVTLHQANSFDILAIDFASSPYRFPPKQGVGLARKVGCDCALALMQQGLVSSSWIATSDIDVQFPHDYFNPVPVKIDIAAINHNFRHVPNDPDVTSWEALQVYEVSLRYYVIGLRHAGSPYAYHSIGSSLYIDYEAYAAVRGFPKRLAGEDFHILSKLSKVGLIDRSHKSEILIKNRPSKRVPFGTGVAVAKLAPINHLLAEHTFYHPNCFETLREWLELVPTLYNQQDFQESKVIFENNAFLTFEIFCQLDNILALSKAIAVAKDKSKDLNSFLKHFQTWFDSLKTLRFIHVLREHAFPSIPCQDTLLNAPFMRKAGLSSKDTITDLFEKTREFEYQVFSTPE